MFAQLHSGLHCTHIRLDTVANACTLTRGNASGPSNHGPRRYHVFPLSGYFQSSGSPRIAGHTGVDSLKFGDTDKPHMYRAVAPFVANFCDSSKSYGDECPSWEKLPGWSSEERVAAIRPVILPLQHSVISSRIGNMIFSCRLSRRILI